MPADTATRSIRMIATEDGLDVTTAPNGVAAQTGDAPATERYVALTDDTFITTQPEDGLHSTLTFIDGGRYLHDGRAAARVAQ